MDQKKVKLEEIKIARRHLYFGMILTLNPEYELTAA
jgi:hypothetical protein